MISFELPVTGSATLTPQAQAALSKLPPRARAKFQAALDSPRARAFARFRAQVDAAQRSERAKADRCFTVDAQIASAHAKAQGEEREAVEDLLRLTLGKSHGILARLNASRRG